MDCRMLLQPPPDLGMSWELYLAWRSLNMRASIIIYFGWRYAAGWQTKTYSRDALASLWYMDVQIRFSKGWSLYRLPFSFREDLPSYIPNRRFPLETCLKLKRTYQKKKGHFRTSSFDTKKRLSSGLGSLWLGQDVPMRCVRNIHLFKRPGFRNNALMKQGRIHGFTLSKHWRKVGYLPWGTAAWDVLIGSCWFDMHICLEQI